ncbi:MAG TPA: TadE/TadG family type IV pilus assembly protein [Candidatus Baltobacteraceae bacterium]|nr:TadE/TadG family type IV pilus assembly protein [Candidatus Baltobacteraceae bacterium]
MKRVPANAGVAIAEFALVLPLLVLVFMGIVETGRLTYFSIVTSNAAHAGAAYGSQSLYTVTQGGNMQAAALADAQHLSQITIPTATYLCQCTNGTTATAVACTQTACSSGYRRAVYAQVTAHALVYTLFDYHALGIPYPWTFSRTATIRVQGDTQ